MSANLAITGRWQRLYSKLSYIGRVRQWLVVRPRTRHLLVFSLFFLIFFAVYFSVSTVSSGDDHFFHFRFAEQMRHDGFFQAFHNFKSIYFSRMAQGGAYFVYYNFLFYLVILPFTFIAPLYLGIKLYAVFAVAAAFTLLYWCLDKFEVRNPLIWTLLMVALSGTNSIWRFFLSRPYALAPSLLLILLVCLYRRQHWGVLLVSICYFYWHSATFFFPIGIALAYYLAERSYKDKGDLKNLIATVSGVVIGLLSSYLISTGFISYMKDIIFGTFWETIIGKKVLLSEGGELYPVQIFDLIRGNALIFASFVMAFSIDICSYVMFKLGKLADQQYFTGVRSRRHLQTAVLLITASFFLGTIVISGRFGDYFTFFAALYIALSFDYLRRLVTLSGPIFVRYSLTAGSSIVLLYLLVSNMLFLQQRIAYGAGPMEMYQVGNWLKTNSKPGDVVYIANWSWFPEIYYNSPGDNYTTGLEPRFTYEYSPEVYWIQWHAASDGYYCKEEKCEALDEEKRLILNKNLPLDTFVKAHGDKIADFYRQQHISYIVSSDSYKFFDYLLDHNHNFHRQFYDRDFGYVIYSVK